MVNLSPEKMIVVGLTSFVMSVNNVWADVSGTVYRDLAVNGSALNTYGVKDANESGVSGITVTVTDASGAVVGAPVVTDANGAWSVAGTSGDVRVEFSNVPSYLASSPVNSGSNTTVQFIADGETANLGLHNPADYLSSASPTVYAPIYVNGNGLQSGGSTKNEGVLVHWNYDDTSNSNANTPVNLNQTLANAAQVGSLWGMAYDAQNKRLYTSTLLRRHMGVGNLGLGGIYRIDDPAGSATVNQWLDLNTLAGVDVGTDPRDSSDQCNALPSDANKPSWDVKAYQQAARKGIGDIDLSEDRSVLYAVNMHAKELIALDIDPATGNGSLRSGFPIAIPEPSVGCSNGEHRPWGLGVNDGIVYVGMVCSAETGGSATDLTGHVLAFQQGSFNATPVLSMDLDYARGTAVFSTGAEWEPWVTDTTWHGDVHPQPIIADIAFDESGAMVLGLMDRHGLVTGNNNYDASCSNTSVTEGHSGGDLLRACPDGKGIWVLENNASCGGVTTAGVDSDPGSDAIHLDEGPGGGNYYWQDGFGKHAAHAKPVIGHGETAVGGLGLIKGRNEVMASVFDPTTTDSGGVKTFKSGLGTANEGGDTRTQFMVYPQEEFSGDINNIPVHMGKSMGIGDLEFLTEPAPLEIGNRVWNDANSNGIQDAGEVGIDGVDVTLNCGGSDVVQTTTGGGLYLFTDSNVTGGIPRNASCTISVPKTHNSLALTTQTATTDETLGSNPDPDTGSFTFTTGHAGQNNHTYDIGYAQANIDLELSKQVTPTSGKWGDIVTYTLTVTNTGQSDASNVQVSDQLPANLTYVPDYVASQGTYDVVSGVWDIGAVAKGATVTLTIQAKLQ